MTNTAAIAPRTPITHRVPMTEAPAAPAPKITWWVYVGADRIRRTAAMRGRVAFDATCSCGWDSRTGGAVRSYVEREVWLHKRIDH